MTSEVLPVTHTDTRSRAAKRVLAALLFFATLCAAAWFGHDALLRDTAELWIVSDPVGPADAVAIFGGGTDTRPFAAAAYYKSGLCKKILVSNVRPGRAEMLLGAYSNTAWNRNVLLKLGVPETAIETFGSELSNTYQEAVALREWAELTHAHSVIVPTEAFSSRRVRWVVDRELSGTGVQVQVPALEDSDYGPSDWWQDEKGIVAFQNEVLKYVYYRIKY